MPKLHTRACEGKRGYRTRLDAENSLRKLLRQRGGRRSTMDVYRCPNCSSWHFGHTKRRRYQR